ncbi:MAG: adenosine deaminase, partial [Paracoccaceae bacterium]|nr:adenosine deaminase [Paracoccaceae bacterium]
MTFQSIPKVELHLHLEGAADPDFVRQIASEKKIDVSGVFDETGSYKYK